MFFHLFSRKQKKKNTIQEEYVDLIKMIVKSPLWDGSDEAIYEALPTDLTAKTVSYAKKKAKQE